MRRYEIRSHGEDIDRFSFDTHPTDDFIIETWKNCIIINYLFFNNTVQDVVVFFYGREKMNRKCYKCAKRGENWGKFVN